MKPVLIVSFTILLLVIGALLALPMVPQSSDADVPDIFTGWNGPVTFTIICDDAPGGGTEEITLTYRFNGGLIKKIELEVDIPEHTGRKKKAELIADAINAASDDEVLDEGTGLKDPLSAQENIRSVSVEADPDKDCSLTPCCTWKSGSGEKKNRSKKDYLPGEAIEVTFGFRIEGNLTGMNAEGEPSTLTLGMLGVTREILLHEGDSLIVRMDELRDYLPLPTRLGTDGSGGVWILWRMDDRIPVDFGGDDLGLTSAHGGSVSLVTDLCGIDGVRYVEIGDYLIHVQ